MSTADRAHWRAAQEALAARLDAAGLLAQPGPVDVAAELERVRVSPYAAVRVRNSRGEAWAVTRLSASTWQASHADGRYGMGALEDIVAMMERQ